MLHCTPLVVFVLAVFSFSQSSASCFGKDAHFDKTVPPVISQPSRTDHTKVLVTWEKQIERPQCVDRYYVRVWPDGTDMASGQKLLVDKKDTKGKEIVKSLEVTVEPCKSYRFRVELEEDDSLTGKDVEMTAEQTFRTTAKPTVTKSLSGLDTKSRPQATYWWDPVKQVVDLSKVSISFPTNTITYPNCLDYIQVTGSEIKTKTGPPLSRKPSTTRGRALSFSHTSNPFITTPGGASTLPAKVSSGNPFITTSGGARTLPAKISYADVTEGSGLSRQSSSSSSASSGSPIPILKPDFAYTLPRPKGGAAAKLGPVKVSPPFLSGGLPEIIIPVSGCNQFSFDIKLMYGGKLLDSITAVVLPPLADIPGYVPAPITSVMTISYSPKGGAIYAVKKDSGVTAACLPAYFEAYDAYIQRLENEAGWQIGKAKKVQNLVKETQADLEDSEEELLKAVGCTCTSPHLELASTDPKVLKHKQKIQLGHYHFGGVFDGYPYYLKKPTPNTTTEKPMFLYFSKAKKEWLVADEVGGTKGVFFGSLVNPSLKCPGDAGMKWQAAYGTFGRWKASPLTVVKCEKNI